jgi:hypothetical protein
MSGLHDIQAAILNLRRRTGCDEYGTCVWRGKFQFQRISYLPSGRAKIKALSPWVSLDELLKRINREGVPHA